MQYENIKVWKHDESMKSYESIKVWKYKNIEVWKYEDMIEYERRLWFYIRDLISLSY